MNHTLARLNIDGPGPIRCTAGTADVFKAEQYFIALATQKALVDDGQMPCSLATYAIQAFGIDTDTAGGAAMEASCRSELIVAPARGAIAGKGQACP